MTEETLQPQEPQPPRATVTGSFFRMAPWMIGSRAVVAILGLVATMGLARWLSKSEWNSYSLLKTFWLCAYLLGQFGLSEAAARFVAELAVWADLRGIYRLLGKILSVQTLVVLALLCACFFAGQWLEREFEAPFGAALIVMIIFAGISTMNETLRQTYVALYRIRVNAILSFIGAALFPIAAYIFVVVLHKGVRGGLAAEMSDFLLMLLVFALLLPKIKLTRTAALDDPTAQPKPVTNYRIARYAGAALTNNVTLLLMGPQVTLILVGYFLTIQGPASRAPLAFTTWP